eukprot:m.22807 g.22807  ORF g.22807 m.22807 type:complete len:388 (-) comp10817_c0_seq1:31-1194(-)
MLGLTRTTALLSAVLLLGAKSTLGFTNEIGLALLEKLEADPAAIKTETGLFYKVVKEGNTSAPTAAADDRCNISYFGKYPGGETFDGTRKPRVVIPKNLFVGLKQAVMLMHPGSKIEVTIPPQLGFGDAGVGKVPGGAVLIFDIELHDVVGPPTGIFATTFEWVTRNPGKIILFSFVLKWIFDWYFGVMLPTGPLISSDAAKGQEGNPKISFDIMIDGKASGTMIAELFSKTVPKTAATFQTLCGKNPKKPKKGKSKFPPHKFDAMTKLASQTQIRFVSTHSVKHVAPMFQVDNTPEFEKGYFSHNSRYLLSMADIRNISGDRDVEFFFTLGKATHYDGQHVVIGSIVQGHSVFDLMEKAHSEGNVVQISKCSIVSAVAAVEGKKGK